LSEIGFWDDGIGAELKRYFAQVAILYVYDGKADPLLERIFSTAGSKFSKISTTTLLQKEQPSSSHLVVLDISPTSADELRLLFTKFSSIETVVFLDEGSKKEFLDVIIGAKVGAVMSKAPSKKELALKLKDVISSIGARQRDRARYENYAKLAEAGGIYFCIRKEGSIVFANNLLLNRLNVQKATQLNREELKKDELLAAIFDIKDNEESRQIKTKEKESFLIVVKSFDSEKIISCIKNDYEEQKHSNLLSHTDFIELLKNMLVHKSLGEEDDGFVVTVRVENSKKILDDFGSEFFYKFFNSFANFCGFFFDKEPFIFWHYDYIVILPESLSEESIVAKTKEMLSQAASFSSEYDLVPVVEASVLILSNMGASEAIDLIERIYGNSQTQADRSKISFLLSSSKLDRDSGQMAMYHLQRIVAKGYKIKLLNIYKGLSVSTPSSVLKIVDSDIHVSTEKIQKYLMHTEKSVIIQSEYLPKEIAAEVKYVDPIGAVAIVKNPIFLESSANNRKSVRVQCDTRIPITVTGQKFAFTGEIFDISLKALSIKYNGKLPPNCEAQSVKLQFSLPSKTADDGIAKLSIPAQIAMIKSVGDDTRVVVYISIDSICEATLLEYIYMRQKELIGEIKKLGGMIFK